MLHHSVQYWHHSTRSSPSKCSFHTWSAQMFYRRKKTWSQLLLLFRLIVQHEIDPKTNNIFYNKHDLLSYARTVYCFLCNSDETSVCQFLSVHVCLCVSAPGTASDLAQTVSQRCSGASGLQLPWPVCQRICCELSASYEVNICIHPHIRTFLYNTVSSSILFLVSYSSFHTYIIIHCNPAHSVRFPHCSLLFYFIINVYRVWVSFKIQSSWTKFRNER